MELNTYIYLIGLELGFKGSGKDLGVFVLEPWFVRRRGEIR